MAKLGEVQPKTGRGVGEEKTFPKVATRVNKKAVPIRPAPPPPHLSRRRPGTRSAPRSRPSAAPTDGCDEPRRSLAAVPSRRHPCLAGLVVSFFRSRVGSTRTRAGHHSPTNKCERRGGRGSLSPFLSLEHSASRSACLSPWMDGALTLSLSSPLPVYLFLLPGHPSIQSLLSVCLSLSPSIQSAASASLSLLQSNQVLGITQRNNSHHHHYRRPRSS